MTIWLEYFSFREFRLYRSIINTVKCLNLEKAAETKPGSSRVRSIERDKQEGWLHHPELETGKALTGVAEMKKIVSVWQPLVLIADDGRTWWMLSPREFGLRAVLSSFIIRPYFCVFFFLSCKHIHFWKGSKAKAIKELSCLCSGHSETELWALWIFAETSIMWQKEKEELPVSELLITLAAIAFILCWYNGLHLPLNQTPTKTITIKLGQQIFFFHH